MNCPFLQLLCSAQHLVQVYSLGNDTTEERNIQPEVLWQCVQTAQGSKVNQAIGGLLTVLNRNASCWNEY